MGCSADGIICYGIIFDDDVVFPWMEEDNNGGDEDTWWLKVSGFKPSVQPYDNEGMQVPGVTDAQVAEYYREQRAWLAKHPMPVEVVWYGHHDYSQCILAVPGTVMWRDSAGPFDPSVLVVDVEAVHKFNEFQEKHGLSTAAPGWILAGRWG